jgi:VRR-NUC domain-containing protein
VTGQSRPRGTTHAPANRKAFERDVQRDIVDALRRLGFIVAVSTAGHRGKGRVRAAYGSGCPDLMVFAGHGRVIFIETKRPVGGVVSEVQARWHAEAARLGVPVLVTRSVEEAVGWAIERRWGKPLPVRAAVEVAP